MLYRLFTDYRAAALIAAVIGGIGTLFLLIILLLAAGSSIRRRADDTPKNGLKLLRVLLVVTLTITCVSALVLLVGDRAVQTGGTDRLSNPLIQALVGAPPHVDARRLL